MAMNKPGGMPPFINRDLAKPRWQPPPRAFGLVWTPLYASIAWAGGHALQRTTGCQGTRSPPAWPRTWP